MKLKEVWQLIKESASAWSDDYASSMGAALSYYTVFSIAPLLLIVIAVAGLVFGREAAQGQIVAQLQDLIGEVGATAVQGLLKSVNEPAKGVIATVVSLATLVIGATSVFAELQNDMDRIWRAPPVHGSGLWHLLRTRLLSFGMILGLAFLLLVSLVVSAALAALGSWWGSAFGDKEALLQALNFFVSFAFITGMFAMIYKLLPRVKIAWRDVWIGATVTALLFSVGKLLIGLYLGKSGVTSGFGAAGSLVVLLIWVYYSAQIFLLGAEFSRVYAHTHGSRRVHPAAAIASTATGESTGGPRMDRRLPRRGAAAPAPALREAPAVSHAAAADSRPGVLAVSPPATGDGDGDSRQDRSQAHPVRTLGLLAAGATFGRLFRGGARSADGRTAPAHRVTSRPTADKNLFWRR